MNKRRARGGQGIVEFAFTLPIFIIVVLGIYDFGRAFHCFSTLNYMVIVAARKGAESNLAVRRFMNGAASGFNHLTNTSLAEVQDAFSSVRSPLMSPDRLTFTQEGIGTNADRVKITATYQLDLITPLIGNLVSSSAGTVTLRAEAMELKE